MLRLADFQVANLIELAPNDAAISQGRPSRHSKSCRSAQALTLRPETEHLLLQVRAMLDSAVCS